VPTVPHEHIAFQLPDKRLVGGRYVIECDVRSMLRRLTSEKPILNIAEFQLVRNEVVHPVAGPLPPTFSNSNVVIA